MKKITNLLIILLMLCSWEGYAQQSNNPVTPKLKYDKSGRVKYIKFDGKDKTGKWTQPSSSAGFFLNVLNNPAPARLYRVV